MDYAQAFFLYTAALKIADALTLLGVWHLCWYLRFHGSWFPHEKGLPPYSQYSRVGLPLMLAYMIIFHVVGAYRRDRIQFGFRALKKIVEGSAVGTLAFVSSLYFLHQLDYSRVYLAIFPLLAIVALILERGMLHVAWKLFERAFVRRIRLVLLGTGELLSMYVSKIERRRPYPFEWVGRLGRPDEADGLAHIPYLGEENDVHQVLETHHIDLVVVSYPTERSAQYAPLLERLTNELVDVKVLPDFGRYSTFTYTAEQECGMPLLVFNQILTGSTDRAIKRLVDVVGAGLFLIVFSPVYLAIALAIKLTSKGPVFYSQQRVGADGSVFEVYKFRSMRVDAEAQTGAVWARPDDDRTTPLGRWLRRTSLDEFPQFYNVLKGDMSLVGPRPERPVFVRQFKQEIPKYMLRHKMKSGITGWAQVNGWRGNTSLEERIKHDLYYIGHWSHFFDLKILCLTPLTVVRNFLQRHAY